MLSRFIKMDFDFEIIFDGPLFLSSTSAVVQYP